MPKRNERPERLDVYDGSDCVGTVHDTAPLAFECTAGRACRFAAHSVALCPGAGRAPGFGCGAGFFWKLLPEGELRDHLAAQFKASTLFSLLFESFVARVADAFAKVRVGTPAMDLDCGPVMNPAQQRRVQRYIDAPRAAGIAVVAEGHLAAGLPATGYHVKPTLFGPVPRGAALAREEEVLNTTKTLVHFHG